jgi:hypothetical protein
MGCGVIPIVHTGSELTFDRGSWVLKGKTTIRIRVLDEIPAEEVKKMDVKILTKMVRQEMVNGLASLEHEHPNP